MDGPALLDIASLDLLGAGAARPTEDWVWSVTSGSALRSFVAPKNANLIHMRSKSATRCMVSFNGRTAFNEADLSGASGGYIGSVGLNQNWDGNVPLKSGQIIYVNMPIGNEIEFTVEPTL